MPGTLALIAALVAGADARGEPLPLWELGLGAAALSIPHYRGADQRHLYLLPLPYVIYRGTYFRADREGIRGRLFDTDLVSLDLSLNGSLPVRSGDNRTRQGMPALDPTVEIGPTLIAHLWRAPNSDARLDLRAPLRAAITVSSSPEHIGWLFAPTLSFAWQNPGNWEGWNLTAHWGPQFGSRRHHAYFYSVAPAEATPGRPAYRAPSGYGGSQLLVSAGKRFPTLWAGAFMRYDSLHGARFEDSPLVRRNSALSFGVGISWIFAQSARRAPTAAGSDQ